MEDRWLWLIDDEPLQALLKADDVAPQAQKRPAGSPALAKALGLHLGGRAPEAIEILKSAIASGGERSDEYALLGQLYFEMQQYGDAAQCYARLAEMETHSRVANFNLGVCFQKQGRWLEAARAFTKAMDDDPERIEVRLALGVCLLHVKRPELALEAFTGSLTRDPGNSLALFGKAVALHMLWRLEEAEVQYQLSLEKSQNPAEIYANLIALGIAAKNEPLVRDCCEKLLILRPEAQPGLEGLLTAAFLRHDYVAGAERAKALTALQPANWSYWYNLGLALHQTGNAAAAKSAYEEALRLKPACEQAHTNMGVLLELSGEREKAHYHFEQAASAAPELQTPLWNLALAAEEDGDLARAESLYQRVAEKDPDSAEVWFRLGYVQLQRNAAPKAAANFERSLTRREDWVDARVNLGIAYTRSGDRDRARIAFEQVLEQEPYAPEALRGLFQDALEAEDLERAELLERRLADAGLATAEVSFNLGVLAHHLGELKQAEAHYRDTLSEAPEFSDALLNLGHALAAMGREEEAKKFAGRALASMRV